MAKERILDNWDDAQAEHLAIVNKRELTSIKALVAYKAHENKVSEETVREIIVTRYGIEDVTKLPRNSYDDVIKFLVDTQIGMLLH